VKNYCLSCLRNSSCYKYISLYKVHGEFLSFTRSMRSDLSCCVEKVKMLYVGFENCFIVPPLYKKEVVTLGIKPTKGVLGVMVKQLMCIVCEVSA